MCRDLVRPFLKSDFRPYYFACGCNRLCHENSLGCDVSPHLHPCVIVGVWSHVLIFYFIIWLLKDPLESYLFPQTISSSTWCHIKGGPCFYFVTWCISWAERIRNSSAQFFVRLVENFGAGLHCEKTCTSSDFFQESSTISCYLKWTLLFTKYVNLLPFREIRSALIEKISYQCSIRYILEQQTRFQLASIN